MNDLSNGSVKKILNVQGKCSGIIRSLTNAVELKLQYKNKL